MPVSRGDSAEDASDDADHRGTPAIAVEGLEKAYGDGEDSVAAVRDVSFTVEPGTAVGLLGPNGAGKTTTIKSLLGLVLPTAGEAQVHGVDVHERPTAAYRRVGAVLEGARNTYWRLTVRENVRFFAALAGLPPGRVRGRIDELLDQFDLRSKADTAVRELSRGQKQKVSLACTLARNADVVFLDEPTLGLDVESSLKLRAELRSLTDDGTTLLLSSHDMDVIEDVCDRVIVMQGGSVIADDTVENLLDAFDTQPYEICVEETVPGELRESLRAEFGAGDFERRAGTTRFTAHVQGDGFYELVERLRTARLTVASFTAIEPDLEEVFIRLTEERYGSGTAAAPADGEVEER